MAQISRNERVLGPLKVGLRQDLHFTRQETRGGPRYIAHDPITFQNHAFSAADYQVLTAIIGSRTLADTQAALVERGKLEDSQEDRESFYRFILWLHGNGLLHLPLANGDLLYDRLQRKQMQKRRHWYQVFLNYKIPLGSPDAFLQRTMSWFGWLFSGPGFLAWAGLMALVVWKCIGHFDDLFAETATILSITNLPLLWAVLIVLKAIHEFGHAYACRRFGAPVPEMGIVLLMMTPCAYVDASASWKLMRWQQRAAVALGGMYVESIIAAFAALVWIGTPPGLVHDIAFNVVALASVITVLFNINPLMKYDGYYLFSDIIGVFNLQRRATRFLGSWVGHFVLGHERPQDNFTGTERLLYGLYGPATFAYRIFLATGITMLVMMQWPSAGVFLAAIFLWALILQPIWRLLLRLWSDDSKGPTAQTRARLAAIAMTTILPMTIAILPVSWHVTAPGILDPRLRETVRAPTAGFVETLSVNNGEEVGAGQTLCRLHNPELEARRARMLGELEAEQVSLDTIELEDPTQAAVHRARIAFLRAGVNEIDNRLRAMELQSTLSGTVASAQHLELQGRFMQQGEEMFQVQSEHQYLRVMLTDEDVSRIRLEIGGAAEVRFLCDPSRPVQAAIREIRAAASREEIPLALTVLGGGDVYAKPLSETSNRAIADRPYLHILLEVDAVPIAARGTGLTARVRLPAHVELLGGWLQRRVLSFLNAWRMT